MISEISEELVSWHLCYHESFRSISIPSSVRIEDQRVWIMPDTIIERMVALPSPNLHPWLQGLSWWSAYAHSDVPITYNNFPIWGQVNTAYRISGFGIVIDHHNRSMIGLIATNNDLTMPETLSDVEIYLFWHHYCKSFHRENPIGIALRLGVFYPAVRRLAYAEGRQDEATMFYFTTSPKPKYTRHVIAHALCIIIWFMLPRNLNSLDYFLDSSPAIWLKPLRPFFVFYLGLFVESGGFYTECPPNQITT